MKTVICCECKKRHHERHGKWVPCGKNQWTFVCYDCEPINKGLRS